MVCVEGGKTADLQNGIALPACLPVVVSLLPKRASWQCRSRTWNPGAPIPVASAIMAPRKVIKQKKRSKFAHWTATCTDFLEKQVFTWPMFSNQSHFQLITYLLLVAELFINLFIVNFCKCKQPFSFVFQVPHFLPVSLYNRHGD